MKRIGILPAAILLLTACGRGDYMDASLPAQRRAELLLREMTLEEKVGQMCQYVGPCHIHFLFNQNLTYCKIIENIVKEK